MTMATTAPARPASLGTATTATPRGWAREIGVYFVIGVLFGIVITKGEVISWFRIQEMFRFEGFHMYGVFATALPVAIMSVQWIKRSRLRALNGEAIAIPPKQLGRGIRYAAGGVIFGLGWALTGACPGPLFALFGAGVGVIAAVIASAIVGTFTYGVLRPRLPH